MGSELIFADGFTRALHWISLSLLIGLVVLVNADIVARNLFDSSIPGVPEIMGQAIVVFVFCQLPNSFARGRILRNDTLLHRLPHRLRRVLTILFHLAAFAILVPLVIQSAPLLYKNWVTQDFIGAVGSFTWPVWPTRLAIIVGSIALMIEIARSLWRSAV